MWAASTDTPEKLRSLVERSGLHADIRFFSDPDLALHEKLGVPISTGHPKARSYPKKAFLQPSVFIWDREGESKFEWRISPGIFNLWGAIRRMTPDEILAEAKKIAAT